MMPALGPVEFWHWWALGGALAIVEVFAPGFVFLWLGIAAGLVGCLLLAVAGARPPISRSCCSPASSVASVLGWRRWQTAHPAHSDQPHLNRRGDQYVGRQSVLAEPIANGRGRIRLGDAAGR